MNVKWEKNGGVGKKQVERKNMTDITSIYLRRLDSSKESGESTD